MLLWGFPIFFSWYEKFYFATNQPNTKKENLGLKQRYIFQFKVFIFYLDTDQLTFSF